MAPALAVTIAGLAMGIRFFMVIRKYSVDVFFNDQWIYLDAFFRNQATVANLFFTELGHREGLGLLPDIVLYPLTQWNTRVDSFLIGGAIFAAMLLALQLKRRLFGPLSYSDIAIPLIFLTTVQFETLLVIPNPAHSGFPLLLIMLYCHALLADNRVLRYALILVLNYLLVFTGFGIFMGAVTIGIFFLECYWSLRHITVVPFIRPFAGLLIAIASLASFFYHYVFEPYVSCFEVPHSHWLSYSEFTVLLFSGFIVPRPVTVSTEIIILGAAIFSVLIVILVWHLLHLLQSPACKTAMIGAVLVGFSLLFAANVSVGRLCLGVQFAFSSRYSTLLIPAFLGIYFYLLSGRWYGMRNLMLGLWIVLLLPGALTLPRDEVRGLAIGKWHWADCYVRTGNIAYCDKSTNFKVFPNPEQTHLQEKLDYLKEHHLNLFAGPLPQHFP
jgi:hypothetical protein